VILTMVIIRLFFVVKAGLLKFIGMDALDKRVEKLLTTGGKKILHSPTVERATYGG
jgi:hypothetical protein